MMETTTSQLIAWTVRFYDSIRAKPSEQVINELRDVITTKQMSAICSVAGALIEACARDSDSDDELQPEANRRNPRRRARLP